MSQDATAIKNSTAGRALDIMRALRLPFVSASLLLFIVVAALKVHWVKGFFMQSGGFEYNFVIACGCLAPMLLGAGKFSIVNKF